MNIEKQSKFKEYWGVFKHAITDIDKVMEARWNKAVDAVGLLDDRKKAEAERRLEICVNCPFNSINAKVSTEFSDMYKRGVANQGNPLPDHMTPHYTTNRSDKDLHCSWCGCDIDSKVLGFDGACGILNYNLVYKMNEPLKWGVFQIPELEA